MFKPKPVLRNADPDNTGGATNNPSSPPSATGAGAPAPAIDVKAEVAKALAAQKTEFAEQLKAATGHSDLKALADASLKAQGKLQELADAKAAEAQSYKLKYEATLIDNALLAAATDAVDPTTVKDLLVGKSKVDEAGNVTIDGLSVADKVKQLLTDKPFLAKAQGGTGSGAPQNTTAAQKNPWSKEHYNLTEQISLQKTNPTLAATLKAAAGK